MLSNFWASQALVKSLYSQCIEVVCAQHGLTRMELDILLFLANHPHLDTASDIVEHRHLAKSHVSTSIQSLERRGFLAKSHTPSNRKTTHLTICDAASASIAAGRIAQDNFLDIILKDFSERERTALQLFLARMSTNIDSYFAGSSK